jgi:hypothetical protein
MRADLVERLTNMLADWNSMGIAALTTDTEAVREAATALRALRDAPVGIVATDGHGAAIYPDDNAFTIGQQVRLVPLDTTAGVEK